VEDTGVNPLLQEIVTKFSSRMWQNWEMDTVVYGIFPVTFRGMGVEHVKKADGTDSKKKGKCRKQCVCGSMHLYPDCYYLNESCCPTC
jgi:hypothetical protein